jgi:hypothetical protein
MGSRTKGISWDQSGFARRDQAILAGAEAYARGRASVGGAIRGGLSKVGENIHRNKAEARQAQQQDRAAGLDERRMDLAEEREGWDKQMDSFRAQQEQYEFGVKSDRDIENDYLKTDAETKEAAKRLGVLQTAATTQPDLMSDPMWQQEFSTTKDLLQQKAVGLAQLKAQRQQRVARAAPPSVPVAPGIGQGGLAESAPAIERAPVPGGLAVPDAPPTREPEDGVTGPFGFRGGGINRRTGSTAPALPASESAEQQAAQPAQTVESLQAEIQQVDPQAPALPDIAARVGAAKKMILDGKSMQTQGHQVRSAVLITRGALLYEKGQAELSRAQSEVVRQKAEVEASRKQKEQSAKDRKDKVQRGRGVEYQINLGEVMRWREERAVHAAVGDTAKVDMEEARRRKVAAEAALAELELARQKGVVIHQDVVFAVVSDEFASVRARLRSIPAALAPAVT